jgi:TetR/AcrR family transcriptional regulator
MRVNEKTQADTRRRLLDAAAATFAELGYHGTRIDYVSQRAGVAKGTIYNYFPSKEAVFETLIAEACLLAVDAALGTPDDAPTRVRLEGFVAANLRWARRRQSLAVLFARELLAGDAEIKRLILRASAPCAQKLAAIFQDGIDRGEVRADAAPQALAYTFISLANMLLLQSFDPGGAWPRVREFPASITTLFLQGVGVPAISPE